MQITISECFHIAGILITKKLKVGVHILISCVQFEINFTIISYIVFQYLYTVTAYIQVQKYRYHCIFQSEYCDTVSFDKLRARLGYLLPDFNVGINHCDKIMSYIFTVIDMIEYSYLVIVSL